uniref:Putative secreted peptide n=1 Tax=Anopheles braziliensis TaxID=58242 RepID=A0A2M3ZTE0_9DIPT
MLMASLIATFLGPRLLALLTTGYLPLSHSFILHLLRPLASQWSPERLIKTIALGWKKTGERIAKMRKWLHVHGA